MLDRHGLVKHGRKRRYKAQGTALSLPRRPNDLWCADYKGEFMLADRTAPTAIRCTITDFARAATARQERALGLMELHRSEVDDLVDPFNHVDRPRQGHRADDQEDRSERPLQLLNW